MLAGLAATLLGIRWAKNQIEARGQEKERRRQILAAARVEAELAASDARILAEAHELGAEIREGQSARHLEEARAENREPTSEEVRRFLEETGIATADEDEDG